MPAYEAQGTAEELVGCLNSNQPNHNGTYWSAAMADEPPYLKPSPVFAAMLPATPPVVVPSGLPSRDACQAPHLRACTSNPHRTSAQSSGKSLVLYPVNVLRNYARLMARTPLVGLIDVDLIISDSLAAEMNDPAKAAPYVAAAAEAAKAYSEGRHGPKYSTGYSRIASVESIAEPLGVKPVEKGGRPAYVLPAFVTRGGSISAQIARADKVVQQGKSRLLEHYQKKKIVRFDPGSSGHRPTDYTAWFRSAEPYPVQWQERYEPWVFVDRLGSSWADARFRGYGKNKIVHVRTLAYEGYDLVVHPRAFLVHRPHMESSSSSAHSRSALYNKKSKNSTMYGHNNHLYKMIQREMAHGNYSVHLDPATAACRGKLSWWRL
eukprot:XP_001701602.1 predicted protein [Chlamydomonas reinhardtii]